MSDDIPENADHVVSVLTERIEAQFDMGMGKLKAAVAARPDANPQATSVVKWHGLLIESQEVLDRAEDDLLAALGTQPGEVDDQTTDLAQFVNAAVTARDGRALVVRYLLDPDAPGKQTTPRRKGPAVQTTAPARPASAPAPTALRAAGRARS
ncbi:hypothetical protein [Streptomyces sp. CMB-StM0423]|uniref:hypothetical protein n=1 Tax=Streptomyces sp. CMB-StM0423 TaxID=2059884 RepID=UPI000C7095F2|nr:hypothetical protein [Streptomyces sp. CMB-StM0423]AUH40507.1 hypothetical protein CXR04_09820 [Streptomyces sp. CMB-StM0423]